MWQCKHLSPLLFKDAPSYLKGDCVSEYVAERLTLILTKHPTHTVARHAHGPHSKAR